MRLCLEPKQRRKLYSRLMEDFMKPYKLTIFAGAFSLVMFAASANANCKPQADAAARAQDASTKACASAAKPLSEKTASEIKNGDKNCRAKEKAYTKAKEKLTACQKKL